MLIIRKGCETGPTVCSPYTRRLESLTTCGCNYKGSTFSSIILKTLSVGAAGVQLGTSPRGSPMLNQLNHASIYYNALSNPPFPYHQITYQNVFCYVALNHWSCRKLWGTVSTCGVSLLCECRYAAGDQMDGEMLYHTWCISTYDSSCLDTPALCVLQDN